MEKNKKRRFLKFFLKLGLFITLFFLLIHFLLNSHTVQKWAMGSLNKILDIQFGWDDMEFTGITGHFAGNKLTLFVPKAHTTFELDKFSLNFNPFKILLKKVHLFELKADHLKITMTAMPESGRDAKAPLQNDPSQNLATLFNMFSIDHGEINDIEVHLPGEKNLHIQKFSLDARTPLLIFDRSLEWGMDNIEYRSPQFDFFAYHTKTSGSLNFNFNKHQNRLVVQSRGHINADRVLLGFNKKPIPWNDNPAFDESLVPLLQARYGNTIPENRSFAAIEKIDLPFEIVDKLFRLDQGRLDIFAGRVAIDALWNRKSGEASLNISTPLPLTLSLFPLGKSNFRRSFEKVDLNVEAKGNFMNLHEGHLKGRIKMALQGNLHVPEVGQMVLTSPLDFKDGILDLPEILLSLGEGFLKASGAVDFNKKILNATLSGKDLNVPTIVHLFSSVDIPGTANCSGKISGQLANPTINLLIDAPEWGYESLHLGQFKGQLDIQEKNLSIKGQTNLGGSGSGQMDLAITEVFRGSQQKVTLKTKFNKMPVGGLFASEVLSGSVDGFFNLDKYQYDYNGSGHLEAGNLMINRLPVARISGDLALDDKKLVVKNHQVQWNNNLPVDNVTEPFTFEFYKGGYRFGGALLRTVKAEGEFNAANPHQLGLRLQAAPQTSMQFFSPLIPLDVQKLTAGGQFEILYLIKDPGNSKIAARLSGFEFMTDENQFHLVAPTLVELREKILSFNQSHLQMGPQGSATRGSITLNGAVGLTKANSNLHIKGRLDLGQMANLQPWFVEGSGFADADVTWTGSLMKPEWSGNLIFKDAALVFRFLRGELTELGGQLKIAGSRLDFVGIHGLYDDGPLFMDGWLSWVAPDAIGGAQLDFRAEELSFSNGESWRLLVNADVRLTGQSPNLQLAGDLQVVEGLYYKDYSLTQFVLKPVGVVHKTAGDEVPPLFKNMNLDLDVKSSGEFLIQNNLADLSLKTNLHVAGTLSAPAIDGAIDVLDGQIHAFGIDFEQATGFVNFTRARGLNPYVEFQAAHEIQDYEIRTKIRGYLDNLAMNLDSTPGLNQNDIISLVAYGRTPDQLTKADQNFFSTTAIASQVVGLLQRPLSKATKLDIIKLESEYNPQEPTISRVSIGKRLTDRFALAFTTDLNIEEASRGITVEYRILDSLLLKGTKDTGSRYRFDLTYRLQSY